MKKSNLTFVMMLSLCALLVAVLLPRQAKAATWQDKVDPWVMESAQREGQTEFLVYLTEQADVSAAADLTTKESKGNYVYQTLTATAARTQGPLLTALREAGADHEAYWVANMIWVHGDLNLVQQLALRSDVGHIYANPTVQFQFPVAEESELIEAAMAVEWNITMVNADDVWAEGYTGQGIVIGGQDTGYDWDHPALINQYRGWNGAAADHNYNWHDAIHSDIGTPNSNPCGYNSTVPCDDGSHGTHTMGTMVGNDMLPSNPSWPAGATNAVGMAPGAKWIGCRNMDNGDGTPTTYSECYQWFIAPTDLTGSNPDPAQAPHVINNSWSCPASEGCTDPNMLLTVVNNVRAAGIVTVHAAGNSGSGCSTISTPAAIYDASYTVGSTTNANAMSGFSSRGPVTIDGSNRLKPDISAPGSGIRSSIPGTGYSNSSGTSMAAPHVAGLVGLLLSARPDMAGDVDDIEAIINNTAVPVNVTQTCGGIPSSTIPNNTFGYGRIDALAMYDAAAVHSFTLLKEATPGSVNHGEMITYTLTITHHHPTSATTNVVLTDTIPVGTTFVSATGPYTMTGNTVEWSYASLSAGASESVQLVVEVEHTATGSVVNEDYGVMSDEVTTPVIGSPVTVIIIPMGLTEAVYLPVILKD